MTPLYFLDELFKMDVAIINIVVSEMSYNVLLNESTNASVSGNDAHGVTSRRGKQEDFIYI